MEEIDELRLEFGDLDQDYQILNDDQYQNLIDKYGNRKKALRKALGMSILAVLSQEVRERSGQEERYGSEAFKNYMDFLKMKIKNPAFSGVRPLVYFGGIFRDQVEEIATDDNIVQQQFYKGRPTRLAEWQKERVYRSTGNIEPDENAISP